MNIYTVIFATVFLIILVSFSYLTRRVRTFEDFSVADRNIGFLMLFMSVSATYIGPGFTLGLTHQAYTTGFFYFFMVLGYALQIILVGLVVAPKLRKKFKTGIYSIGDIIGGSLTHNNRGLRLFSGVVAFGLILGFSIVMFSAAVTLLSYFFDWGALQSVVIFGAVTFVYCFSGGIRASIHTDMLQFGIFAFIIPLLLVFLILNQEVSIVQVTEQISHLTKIGFNQHNFLAMAGLVLSFTLGELLLPPLIGRILAAKDPLVSKKSFIYSGIFLIIWLLIMFLIGVLGTFGIHSVSSDTILLELGREFLPKGLYGIFIIAMLSVVMSSLDSLVNYGSTLFTRDITGIVKPSLLFDDRKQLEISKITTAFIILFSAVFAVFVPSVLEALLLCYNLWVPTILVVLIVSIHKKNLSIYGAYASMLSGLLVTIMWYLVPSLADVFPAILAGLLASVAGYLLGYHFDQSKIVTL